MRKLVPWHAQPVYIFCLATKTTNAATVADHIDSQLSAAPLADDIYRTVVGAKAVTLAPPAQTPVLVSSTCLETNSIELADGSANHALLNLVREVLNVALYIPFPTFLTYMLNKLIRMPKHTVLAHVTDSTTLIIATEAALRETHEEIIGAAHYNSTVDKDTQKFRDIKV